MKTIIENTTEAMQDYINSLSDTELINLHNTYCQNNNYTDDEIYSNDEEFFDTFFQQNVIDAVRAVSYGNYQYTHSWIKFNGYGNLESFDYVEPHIDTEAIIADIQENPGNYNLELTDEQ